MKRLLTFGLGLGMVAAMALPAVAGGPADKATGSGTWLNHQGTEQIVTFNAHEAEGVRPAKGYLYQEAWGGTGRNGTFEVADITFVEVDVDNGFACFAGVITAATGDFYDDGDIGKTRWTVVVDGGYAQTETGGDYLRGGTATSRPSWCTASGLDTGGNDAWWGGNVQLHPTRSYNDSDAS